MNGLKFCSLIVPVILLSLTSCLGEINSEISPGTIPAVVEIVDTSSVAMANTRYGLIYSKDLAKYSGGKCILVNFSHDASKAPLNGYYDVTLSASESVNQQNAKTVLTDTTLILPNEREVLSAIYSDALYDYLDGYLFLPSLFQSLNKQVTQWELSYDQQQKTYETDGKRIYALYLRASAVPGKTGDPAPADSIPKATVVNAFNIAPFFNDISAKELAMGSQSFYLQIHYVDFINANDSADFSWGATGLLNFDIK